MSDSDGRFVEAETIRQRAEKIDAIVNHCVDKKIGVATALSSIHSLGASSDEAEEALEQIDQRLKAGPTISNDPDSAAATDNPDRPAREGTPAARMPQVAKEVRKERAARLRMAGEKRTQQFYTSWIDKEVNAVIELNNIAHTDHFVPVRLLQPTPSGALAKLHITGINAGHLQGVVLQ